MPEQDVTRFTEKTREGKIRYVEKVVQTYSDEEEFDKEFLEQYRQKLKQVEEQLGEVKKKIENTLDRDSEGETALHTLIDGEPQDDEDSLKPNAVTESTVQDYFNLQQLNNQRKNLEAQKDQIKELLDKVRSPEEAQGDEEVGEVN